MGSFCSASVRFTICGMRSNSNRAMQSPDSNAEKEISAEEEVSQLVSRARAYRRRVDRAGQPYIPNSIPFSRRIWHVFLSTLLVAYGTVGLLLNEVLVPGRRGSGYVYRDIPMWLVLGAMLAATCNLLAVVIDHYDRRENERYYRIWARYTQALGWALFAGAFILEHWVFRAGTYIR